MTDTAPAVAVIAIAPGHADDPLAAAARFYRVHLPELQRAVDQGCQSLVLSFDYAPDKPHCWRREAVAALARKYAPVRINAVAPASASVDEAATAATFAFLHANGGVTGQLLLSGTLGA